MISTENLIFEMESRHLDVAVDADVAYPSHAAFVVDEMTSFWFLKSSLACL